MNSRDIRNAFLDFFKSKQHTIVSSAPMVVKNDPTLMFTNAGMNQFKDYFLGNKKAENTKVANTQKCLRVSGKHNDLEEVGIDTYHHTMFEMLGNWSFGDYFKEEAIAWSWELLVDTLKLPQERLYATVFQGDEEDGLQEDIEAYSFWKKYLPEDRILKCSKKDNFWEMGDSGPCGPCSELHIDLRPEEEIAKIPGHKVVNEDDPQVIEIWNLVFIQYNRSVSGQLSELPAKHIDTGMGFERLTRVMQGKSSNYDTDIFQPLIQHVAKLARLEYGKDEKIDIALRVIADHIRAVAFAVADGQLPSNNGAGYVIRRILRRAVRYGYTFLGLKEPFMYQLVNILADQFDGVFPEMAGQKDFIAKVVQEEEASFLRTLDNGLGIINTYLSRSKDEKVVEGKVVFELYDTFGFPLDLTQLIARENGFDVDIKGFEVCLKEQKDRSRKDAASEKTDWVELIHDADVEFLGYDQLEATAKIIKYREITAKNKTMYQLVFDKTPFYAESGGQVGDVGYIEANDQKVSVIDTKKENDLILHFTKELPADTSATFVLKVNAEKRKLTENNHSATHLLHSALKEVLGDHVAQKGSYVSDKLLRFDFSHFSKMTAEEIEKVEKIVNKKIRENIPLEEKRNVPIEDAKSMGATALFGEKYGDFVRVITFDPTYSIELCGGTHVQATGNIGLLKIVSEGSVAAGVRRIEAITADEAEEYIDHNIDLLNQIKEALKNPKDVSKAVEALVQDKNNLQKQIEAFQQQEGETLKREVEATIKTVGELDVLIKKVKLSSADALKQIAFDLKKQYAKLFMVLAADVDGKPQIAVAVGEEALKKDLHAGNIVRELAKNIQGGGGGQPFFATAGGKNLAGLDDVVAKAEEFISIKEEN